MTKQEVIEEINNYVVPYYTINGSQYIRLEFFNEMFKKFVISQIELIGKK